MGNSIGWACVIFFGAAAVAAPDQGGAPPNTGDARTAVAAPEPAPSTRPASITPSPFHPSEKILADEAVALPVDI
jgi:hypothetical protein